MPLNAQDILTVGGSKYGSYIKKGVTNSFIMSILVALIICLIVIYIFHDDDIKDSMIKLGRLLIFVSIVLFCMNKLIRYYTLDNNDLKISGGDIGTQISTPNMINNNTMYGGLYGGSGGNTSNYITTQPQQQQQLQPQQQQVQPQVQYMPPVVQQQPNMVLQPVPIQQMMLQPGYGNLVNIQPQMAFK